MKNYLGKELRSYREKNGYLLREVASKLNVDTAYLSKIELGARHPKKEQIILLSNIYKVNQGSLLILWLAQKVEDILIYEDEATDVLDLVKKRILDDKDN